MEKIQPTLAANCLKSKLCTYAGKPLSWTAAFQWDSYQDYTAADEVVVFRLEISSGQLPENGGAISRP